VFGLCGVIGFLRGALSCFFFSSVFLLFASFLYTSCMLRGAYAFYKSSLITYQKTKFSKPGLYMIHVISIVKLGCTFALFNMIEKTTSVCVCVYLKKSLIG
jgi:hypothetical protein